MASFQRQLWGRRVPDGEVETDFRDAPARGRQPEHEQNKELLISDIYYEPVLHLVSAAASIPSGRPSCPIFPHRLLNVQRPLGVPPFFLAGQSSTASYLAAGPIPFFL
ncbi:uncharacterized protein LOC124650566 [Lolium rigidum]|uniref:uncharacterized protein LOC124650566 n=1 Tax=Lolium rigidum TaxID=89674 RepID=UPI001F5D02C8|nr:uncharacterized protein LOC124650566 [Lolium rigidum]